MNTKTLRIFSTIFSALADLTEDERETVLSLLQAKVKTTTVPAFSEPKPKLYDLRLMPWNRLVEEHCYLAAIKAFREVTKCSLDQGVAAFRHGNFRDFPNFVGTADGEALQTLCDKINTEWARNGKRGTLAWVHAHAYT